MNSVATTNSKEESYKKLYETYCDIFHHFVGQMKMKNYWRPDEIEREARRVENALLEKHKEKI